MLFISVTSHVVLFISVKSHVVLFISVTSHVVVFISVTSHVVVFISVISHVVVFISVTSHDTELLFYVYRQCLVIGRVRGSKNIRPYSDILCNYKIRLCNDLPHGPASLIFDFMHYNF